jgi:hypothetical protein
LAFPLPCDSHDSGHEHPAAEIDLQYRSFDVEVVESNATVKSLVGVAVHSSRCVTVLPLGSNMALVLTFVVDPRFFLEG